MGTGETHWQRAIPGASIHADEVHVWRAFLDLQTHQTKSLAELLSTDEVERANRFRFERDQIRFVAARGMLRMILGHYLGEKPNTLRFDYNTFGKPSLVGNADQANLCFNLSHSGTFALYAVTLHQKVGIDIERIREDIAVGQIANRFFSRGEISLLEQVEENKRTEAFFQYWTRKEAFIKATGEGVSFPLEQCDVSLMSGSDLSPIVLKGGQGESARWHGQDVFPGPGYTAAVVVEGSDWVLSCREFAG